MIRDLRPQIPHFERDRNQSRTVTALSASEEFNECLRQALQESHQRGFNYTGTEQLLFGACKMAVKGSLLEAAMRLLGLTPAQCLEKYEELAIQALSSPEATS